MGGTCCGFVQENGKFKCNGTQKQQIEVVIDQLDANKYRDEKNQKLSIFMPQLAEQNQEKEPLQKLNSKENYQQIQIEEAGGDEETKNQQKGDDVLAELKQRDVQIQMDEQKKKIENAIKNNVDSTVESSKPKKSGFAPSSKQQKSEQPENSQVNEQEENKTPKPQQKRVAATTDDLENQSITEADLQKALSKQQFIDEDDDAGSRQTVGATKSIIQQKNQFDQKDDTQTVGYSDNDTIGTNKQKKVHWNQVVLQKTKVTTKQQK